MLAAMLATGQAMDTRTARDGYVARPASAQTMQAIVFDAYGPADVLRVAELPLPA